MYFIKAVGAFSPSTVRGLIHTYTRGFITISHLVSATNETLFEVKIITVNICKLCKQFLAVWCMVVVSQSRLHDTRVPGHRV